MKLSVVIICKNEQRFIAQCIEAVIRATSDLPDREVILVDSCSVDNTIAIAAQYPITILQLRLGWRHTPAAGRYIGYLRSHGKFILFVDGDSILHEGFIPAALDTFKERLDVGIIVGCRREVYRRDGVIVGEAADVMHIGSVARFVERPGGTAVYRRIVFEKAGCFNPFLFSDEEAELAERVSIAGYKALAIPVEMTVHHTVPRELVGSFFRRMHGNFLLGQGQVIRLRLSQGLSSALFIRDVARPLQSFFWVVIGLFCLIIGVVVGTSKLVLSWVGLSLLLFLGFVLKSRGVNMPLKCLLFWPIQACFIIRGFLLKPLGQSDYPTDALVLREIN